MVKLSQQLRAANGFRETRTERVLREQEGGISAEDRSLVEQANELQRTRFSDIQTVEQYTTEFNKLSSQLQQFFVSPREVVARQETIRLKEVSNIDRLINKREASIVKERNREDPRKDRLDRLDSELTTLENQRSKVARGEVTSEAAFRFAKSKAEFITRQQTGEVRIRFTGAGFVQETIEKGKVVASRFLGGKPAIPPTIKKPIPITKKIKKKVIIKKILDVPKEPSLQILGGVIGLAPITPRGVLTGLEITRDIAFGGSVFGDEPTTLTPEQISNLSKGNIIDFERGIVKGREEAEDVLDINQDIAIAIEELEDSNFNNRTKEFNLKINSLNEDISELDPNLPANDPIRKNLENRLNNLQNEKKELEKLQSKFDLKIEGINIVNKAKGFVIKKVEDKIKVFFNNKDVTDLRPVIVKALDLEPDAKTRIGIHSLRIGQRFGETFVPFNIIGKLGIFTKIDKQLGRLGKVIKISDKTKKGLIVATVATVGGGVTISEALQGYQFGVQSGRAVEETVVGALKGTASVGGAILGGVHGAKAFRSEQQRIFDNAIRKSIFGEETVRVGKIPKEKPVLIKQFGRQVRVTPEPSISGKVDSTLKEIFTKSQPLGVGAGLVSGELTTAEGTIKGGGSFFALRSQLTGNVRLKVFTPTRIKNKLFSREDIFLIKQQQLKNLLEVSTSEELRKILSVTRNVRQLPGRTIKPSEVPGSFKRAFDSELITELKGKAFRSIEFENAKPFVVSKSLETVIQNLRTGEFTTQARGIGITEEIRREIFERALEKGIPPLAAARGLRLPPEVVTSTRSVVSEGLDIQPTNIAQQIAEQRILSLQNEILLYQQGITGGVVTSATVEGLTRELEVGRAFNKNIEEISLGVRQEQSIAQELQNKVLQRQQNVIREVQQQILQNTLAQQIAQTLKTEQVTQQALQTELVTPVTGVPTPFVQLVPSPPPPPIFPPFIIIPELEEERRRKKEFELFIKREGRFAPAGIKGGRGEVLRTGAEIVRDTLAATFKIIPTGREIEGMVKKFVPDPKFFRPFRIVKGKRVPLEDTFIQKVTAPGGRLGTAGELEEIMFAKRLAGRRRR